jgi:Dolichyl-phosphate-mannose-protein mannosyltransferase
MALTALTAIAFALRVSQLHQSLVGDEVSTYLDISGHSFGTVLSTVHTGAENSPPPYFLLAWLSAKLGDPTELIRLPSLLLGTATVPVVYAIGRASVGRAAGLAGAAIFALAPFTVYYGVEARPCLSVTDLWLPRGLSASVPAAALVLGGLLVAMPRRLKLAGITIVLVVLVAGTIRSFDAAYARPPFRVLAAHLDRVAGRNDPVLLLSFIAQPAISVELTKPHRIVKGLPELWNSVPPGRTAYVVIDESLDRALKLGTRQHPGFHVASRRRYLGDGFATDLLAYRRQHEMRRTGS